MDYNKIATFYNFFDIFYSIKLYCKIVLWSVKNETKFPRLSIKKENTHTYKKNKNVPKYNNIFGYNKPLL
jgi:hypothetical protein